MAVGRPRQLFAGSFDQFWAGASYSPDADGQRFLMVRVPERSRPRTLQVVLNWFTELEAPRSAAR